MKTHATLLMAAALTAAATTGLAQPCETELPEAGAPVRTQLGPASFGTIPEACGVNELSARGRMNWSL